MKQALIWFIGQDIRYDRGTFEEQMLVKILLNGDDNMVDKLEVGTIITDRNGKEFKAYSSLITEYKESLELLAKVDIVDISQNIDDTEAQEALLEIIYRALNKAVTKRKILKSLDAEFARKCIRVYYDLPIGA
jgi:DNA-binding protein YbaB